MAATGLLIVVLVVPKLMDAMRECASPFFLKILWETGKYTFAASSLLSLGLPLRHSRLFRSRMMTYYFASIVWADCYVLAVLIINHWF